MDKFYVKYQNEKGSFLEVVNALKPQEAVKHFKDCKITRVTNYKGQNVTEQALRSRE